MIEDRPVTNLGQALQGVVPNLNINFADGHPGSAATFNIRGFTSLNGGVPLVVIDGVPGDPNLVNPLDVESVSVLKDASSAAIYGSRASNGVVFITTKKGKAGRLRVTYDGWVGTVKGYGIPKMLNADQYISLKTFAVANNPSQSAVKFAYAQDKAKTENSQSPEPLPIDVSGFQIAQDGKTIAIWAKDPATPGEKHQEEEKADAVWVDHDA